MYHHTCSVDNLQDVLSPSFGGGWGEAYPYRILKRIRINVQVGGKKFAVAGDAVGDDLIAFDREVHVIDRFVIAKRYRFAGQRLVTLHHHDHDVDAFRQKTFK